MVVELWRPWPPPPMLVIMLAGLMPFLVPSAPDSGWHHSSLTFIEGQPYGLSVWGEHMAYYKHGDDAFVGVADLSTRSEIVRFPLTLVNGTYYVNSGEGGQEIRMGLLLEGISTGPGYVRLDDAILNLSTMIWHPAPWNRESRALPFTISEDLAYACYVSEGRDDPYHSLSNEWVYYDLANLPPSPPTETGLDCMSSIGAAWGTRILYCQCSSAERGAFKYHDLAAGPVTPSTDLELFQALHFDSFLLTPHQFLHEPSDFSGFLLYRSLVDGSGGSFDVRRFLPESWDAPGHHLELGILEGDGNIWCVSYHVSMGESHSVLAAGMIVGDWKEGAYGVVRSSPPTYAFALSDTVACANGKVYLATATYPEVLW